MSILVMALREYSTFKKLQRRAVKSSAHMQSQCDGLSQCEKRDTLNYENHSSPVLSSEYAKKNHARNDFVFFNRRQASVQNLGKAAHQNLIRL